MDKFVKKTGWSIFTTQTVSYLLIILVITGAFSLFFFRTAKSHLAKEIGRKLQDIASIAAKNAPFERLDLIKPGDEKTRMVLRLNERLLEIREATGVENIYIFRPDRSSLIDLSSITKIGKLHKIPQFQRDFIFTLNKDQAVSTGSYQTLAGKLFISAYAPVFDNRGEVFAIVGVDAGTREIEVIEGMGTRLYLIAILGVLLAFGLSLLLARSFSRPIRAMAKTAERIGQGDYKARVTTPGTKELGILANSINNMTRQVQNRDGKLKEMSASIAHEIRNPLNSIKLLITLLGEQLHDQQDANPEKTLDTLHYEIGKLNRFLTEFMTYSRPITLVHDYVSPLELAKSASDMAMAEATEKEVTIDVSAGADLPNMYVDRERMEQSLLNVLLNAIQACDQEGHVLLKIFHSKSSGNIEFIIEDSGSGISTEKAEMLFEPFFTTKHTGTGLGLSNTKKIVKSHDGTIYAENIHNGARFVISLPLKRDD